MAHELSTHPSLPPRAGIGLRAPLFDPILKTQPDIGWLEIHPENYFGGGHHVAKLETIAEHYPLSFHCVGLSLGSVDPVKEAHLASLKKLVDRFNPAVISDHVAWSASGNAHYHDLLPLPYNNEALDALSNNIKRTQDYLGRNILLENPSAYLAYNESTMEEAAFMQQLHERTGCGILLDINNIIVQAHNLGVNAAQYFSHIDPAAVGEMHLAGHSEMEVEGRILKIDTHSRPVSDAVWALYAKALDYFGATPTLIEWDKDIPTLNVMLEEAEKAEALLNTVILGRSKSDEPRIFSHAE